MPVNVGGVVGSLLSAERPASVAALRDLLAQIRRRGNAVWQPSPIDWRDEVLYFLLPDRFSDGDTARPLLTRAEIRGLRQTPSRPDIAWNRWAESGTRWQGGTLTGIERHLGYLRGLGVTALWIGPIFKQRARLDTYHGYGIQDFLDVDPRFGTRDDLVSLVRAAHLHRMRVILDIIVNHSGDNWGYVPPGAAASGARNEPPFKAWPDFYGNPDNPAASGWRLAWRDEHQRGIDPAGADPASADPGGPHDAVFPIELRDPSRYTRAGMGDLGAGAIDDGHAEHKRTDFFALKDLALDSPDTLAALTDCYKYWIAITDCDGFRIDTVKHMALEETRNFCGAIREFAETLGKRNFLLVGEIAGGDQFQDFVLDHLATLQRNLSAALDIGSARMTLQAVGKGLRPASDYFDAFTASSQGFESHRAFGDRHVSILDDHDHVFGAKVRFSTEIPDDSPVKDYQIVAPTALQLFTLGIPCVYYGSEQALAGPAHSQLPFLQAEGWNDGGRGGDRYLREAMFGPVHPRAHHSADLETQIAQQDDSLPGFGAFGTTGRHLFDPASPAYVRIAALCRTRTAYQVLRSGRQYQRQTRAVAPGFSLPAGGELVAWSRILDAYEAVIVVNPNGLAARGADVVVSAELSRPGDLYSVVVNTTEVAAESGTYEGTHPAGSTVTVQGLSGPGEPAFIEIRDVRPAEVIVLLKVSEAVPPGTPDDRRLQEIDEIGEMIAQWDRERDEEESARARPQLPASRQAPRGPLEPRDQS